MTQRQRVLAALEDAGASGVSPVDFLGPQVIDGGKPILRVAPRVEELRKQGYRISSYRQPDSTVRYVLLPDSMQGLVMAQDDEPTGRGGSVRVGRPEPSEGLETGSQHSSMVVVTEAGDGTSPADCPSEGLFDTDAFKPAPEYPR